MMYDKAYVFSCDAKGRYLLAGTLQAGVGAGTFEYSPDWLNVPWAYPLDPVNLPLSAKRYRTLSQHGVFGVFRDAAPDDWGTRIMLLRNQHAPQSELERLLRTSGGGVGQLRFSLSRNRALQPKPLPEMAALESLAQLAGRVDARQQLQPEELELLEPGSSMGGARPKVTVHDKGVPWLVKLGKSSDLVDMPLLEYCSALFLSQKLGINIPPVKLIQIGGRHAFAVQRFDHGDQGPKHFISANSLFNQDKIRLVKDSRLNPYSYCNLAKQIRQHCADFKADAEELFRRMVANIVMGNTDDHARNHALLYDIRSAHWQLSPAYDMLPVVGSNAPRQAMGVGRWGAQSNIANALSYAELFGLDKKTAEDVVHMTISTYKEWPQFCEKYGMAKSDVSVVKNLYQARSELVG